MLFQVPIFMGVDENLEQIFLWEPYMITIHVEKIHVNGLYKYESY